MSSNFVIEANDLETMVALNEKLKSQLASLHIQPDHPLRTPSTPPLASSAHQSAQHSTGQYQVAFGATVQAGPWKFIFTIDELMEAIRRAGPTAVNAVFDTLEQFKERITLLVDGKPSNIYDARGFATLAAFNEYRKKHP